MSGSDVRPDSSERLTAQVWRRAYVVAGLAYPFWHLLSAPGATDPAWGWWAVGFALVATMTLARVLRLSTARTDALGVACSMLVAFHLILLVIANPEDPLYTV